MKFDVKITVFSHPKYLGMIRDVTTRFCGLCGTDEATTANIRLAVDEACSNVIRHGYRGDTSRRIIVKYGIAGDRIRIAVEDDGRRARLREMKGRDLDDVRPGGLGMHFIHRVFDSVSYDHRKRKGNRLLLVRRMERDDEH